jgi:hypothetical protein
VNWANFTAAYNQATTQYAYSQLLLGAAITDNTNAWNHYYAGQVLPAIADILYWQGKVMGCIQALETYTPAYDIPYVALWMWNYLYTNIGGTLKMGDILTAMLTAKYDELQKFVGIEDAYRSAIWEQPFNSEFYAALARGFMP